MSFEERDPYFALDPSSRFVIIRGANSTLPPVAVEEHSAPRLNVEDMFRDGRPFLPSYTARILGARLSQDHAYDILQNLLWMLSSIRIIGAYIDEDSEDQFIRFSDPCLEMLSRKPSMGETASSRWQDRIVAQDRICARHASVIHILSRLISAQDGDYEDTPPMWPREWEQEFPRITSDFMDNHVQLIARNFRFDYGTVWNRKSHEALFGSKLQFVYKFLSQDVEKAVEVLVKTLGTKYIR
jgi:hypothetical protein